jgi:hypothetical protein
MTADPTEVNDEVARRWRVLLDRLESEPDERVRSNLEVVARHVRTEYLGDFAAVMETLVADPHHEYLGVLGLAGPRGPEAVKGNYESDSRAGNRHIFEFSSVVVDRDCVVLEGTIHNASWGSHLIAHGIGDASEIDPDRRYVSESPMLVVLPIDEHGLIIGERVYITGVSRLRGDLSEVEEEILAPHAGASGHPRGRSGPNGQVVAANAKGSTTP